MNIFNEQCLSRYKADDVVLGLIEAAAAAADERFTSHRWLVESLPKRMVYHAIYGDLLACDAARKRVLDVGGGFTALTRLLVHAHDYQLVDLLVHDDHDCLAAVQKSLGTPFWLCSDWHDFVVDETYDVVIANDLFPNVDQRLELFLNKFLPVCGEVRISLTYYNESRWYRVRRVDADEVFHILAWDGAQLKRVLEKFADSVGETNLDQLLDNVPSLFKNGRQVADVRFRGERELR